MRRYICGNSESKVQFRFILEVTTAEDCGGIKAEIKESTWVRCIRTFMGIYFPSSSPFFDSIPVERSLTSVNKHKTNELINAVFTCYPPILNSSVFSESDQPMSWSPLEESGALSSCLTREKATYSAPKHHVSDCVCVVRQGFNKTVPSLSPKHKSGPTDGLNEHPYPPPAAPRPAQSSACSQAQTPSVWVC